MKLSAGLRSFSASFFQVKTKRSFAWANSKGSDSVLLLRWLYFYVGLQLVTSSCLTDEQKAFFKTYRLTVDHSLKAFDLMYTHGLWLRRECATVLHDHLSFLLRGYKQCARMILDLNHNGFGLKRKFHGMAHLKFSIRQDLLNGVRAVINPMYSGCEQNEDKIGKVSRVSRKVSTRTITNTILQRYMLKKKAVLRRSRLECKHSKP